VYVVVCVAVCVAAFVAMCHEECLYISVCSSV